MTQTMADAITALDGYIAELEAVTDRTPAQEAKLATYQSRRANYTARMAAATAALVPRVPPAVDPATLGPWGQVPADTDVATWLAGPSFQSCDLLHQYIYVWLHPGAEPHPDTWPIEDTAAGFIPEAIAARILSALGYGGIAGDGSQAPNVTADPCAPDVTAYLLPVARRLMYAAEVEVTPDHYIWPDAAWSMVGGRNLAMSENDPALLPPDDPRPRWSGSDLFARLASASGVPLA